MALNVRNSEKERLAGALARQTSETRAEALRDQPKRSLADELEEIAQHCAALPVLDSRPADEILGFDDVTLADRSL